MKIKLFFAFFLFIGSAYADVDQKIDQALEFAAAGRADLSLELFKGLLETKLNPVEKATVLYNMSTLYAQEAKFWQSVVTLSQIDDAMFEAVTKESPTLAVQIAYNGAICSQGFAEHALAALRQNLTQDEVDHISIALALLQKYSAMFSEEKTLAADFQENIKNMRYALGRYEELLLYSTLDKNALLGQLGGLLQQEFQTLLDAYEANGADEDSLGLYMKAIVDARITYCIERLETFMQAPVKKEVKELHGYLLELLQTERKQYLDAFLHGEALQALYTLNTLSNIVLLIEDEVYSKDVKSALVSLQAARFEALSSRASPKLASFWQGVWQNSLQFTVDYIAKKASFSDPTTKKLLLLLQKRIQNSAFDHIQDDISYWNVLSQPEEQTYEALAAALHGADRVDTAVFNATVDALIDRLHVFNKDKAIEPLERMKGQNSTTVLFQDSIESWFYDDQKRALSYLLALVDDEITSMQQDPLFDASIAYADYQLLCHLLSMCKVEKAVYEDLLRKESWFTQKQRRDLDFFTISLEIGWLKTMLTGEVKTLKGITEAVDFGVDFQTKTIGLVRLSEEPGFTDDLALITTMQQKLVESVGDGLAALPTKGSKIQKVIQLLEDAKKELGRQTSSLKSMQKVQSDLEEASKILHSMQSESESQSSQKSQMSQEMQKANISLTPELSIRLLQEMEREDRSLETQNVPQATGVKRPW